MDRFFHKGYFCEMFRRLRTAGIVSASILALFTLTGALTSAGVKQIPSASTMAGTPMLYVYVMGFVLTLSAYRWLNKRSGSDFHHALPVSRRAMFFSTYAAIMLWMVIGLLGSAVVNTVINLVFFRPFNYLLYLCVIVNLIICSMAIVAAVSLACALTGTPFVNFIAAVVILFLPRVLFTIMGAFVSNINGSLVLPNVSILFDPSFNIAGTWPYVSLFAGFGAASAINYANVWAMLYSLAYAVLLLILGCVAFVRRRSEDAGVPTSSRALQIAIGCAFGLPLLLVIAFSIVQGFTFSTSAIVVLALISFVAYCLYHLISTKSFKKMCAALPYYLICVAIAALYCVLPGLIVKSELALDTSKSNVEGYSIEREGEDSILSGLLGNYFDGETYNGLLARKIVFTDDKSVETAIKPFNGERANDPYGYEDMGSYSNYSATIRLHRKHGKDIVRRVGYTEREWNELAAIRNQNEEYVNASTAYPTGRLFYSVAGLSPADSERIGECFAKEYASLAPEQRALLLGDNDLGILGTLEAYIGSLDAFNQDTSLAAITVNGCKGVDNFTNGYKITELTPETADLLVKLANESGYEDGIQKLEKIAERISNGEGFSYDDFRLKDYFYLSSVHSQSGVTSNMGYYDLMDEGDYPEYCKELISIYSRGKRAESHEGAVKLSCTGDNGSDIFFVALSPEDEARAEELIGQMNKYYSRTDYGSFTDGVAYSYDGRYFAYPEAAGSAELVRVFDSNDTDAQVFSFSPARSMDFYGICWEEDNYNIWILSGDIGCKCYRFADGEWILDEDAVLPDYIESKYY